MSRFGENTIRGLGNMEEFFTTDLLTSPIRRLIDRDDKRAGVNLHNSRRTVASLLGSSAMGATLGAVLGPPGSILGGLFGYVIAIGSEYEGDRIENNVGAEEAALYVLELKAFQIAAEITCDLVIEETWADICEEVEYESEGLSEMPDSPESLDDALTLMFEVVDESIRRVDFEAYSVFTMAYEEARLELGI